MATFNSVGGKRYYLGATISSTATTILLSSFLEPATGTPLTMSNMNTDICYGTIAPKTSSSEFISFTGVTQNANGTATLTGVTRGLAKKSPFTSSSSYKLPHSGQSVFILSDAPQLFNKFVSTDNTETVGGVKTFSSLPETTAGNPTTDNQFARKAYVDATATGGATTNKTVVAGTAGETITIGQAVYLKASDGLWWLTDADTASTVENVIKGIAQGAGTAGNAITNGVLTYGIDTNQTGLSANTKYYFGNTAGGFSSSAGTVEVTAGYALSTTSIFFNPGYDQQLTEDQQDALVGDNTDIPVGAGNKFVTQTGLQKSAEVFAVDGSGSSTAYTATLSPIPTSLTNGMVVRVKIGVANTTTTPTLNVNGLGAKTIVKGVTTALNVGDIGAGQYCTFIYDSTNTVWVLQNPVIPVATGLVENKLVITTTGVTLDNTEKTLITATVPANFLGTNNGLKGELFFGLIDANAVGSATLTLRYKYGATTLITLVINLQSVTNNTAYSTFALYGNGATNAQKMSAWITRGLDGSTATPDFKAGLGTSAIDSTSAQTITVTGQIVGNSGAFDTAYIEKIS